MTSKLAREFQDQFTDRLFYDKTVFNNVGDPDVLHDQTMKNPLSSSAACINVLGSLANDPKGLMVFLNTFDLKIEEILPFPTGVDVGGRIYNDSGYVVFEWVGPKKSPIKEVGGGRGKQRTSIDGFVIGRIGGAICQIFIEWKFTEGKSYPLTLGLFSGCTGVERLRRYSTVLAELRKRKDFPFKFSEEYSKADLASGLGLADLSPDHLYQLLRMTLLAKTTTPIKIGEYDIQDYRLVHLSHSQNDDINIIHNRYLDLCPGLKNFSGQELHAVWREILVEKERSKFASGYWDQSLSSIQNTGLRKYLLERYAE
jgi:hypothetical protein